MIVDDDVELSLVLKTFLSGLGYLVEVFRSSEDFLLSSVSYDALPTIFIFDLNLPGLSGKDLVKFVRATNKISPVFVMSGELGPEVITEVLACGADDYLTKPYAIAHLEKKIENARKKLCFTLSQMIDVGIKLIPEASIISFNGKRLKLTRNEYRIVEMLITDCRKVVSRDELLNGIGDSNGTHRTIDVHVANVRRKIGELKLSIDTVRGQGYRMTLPENLATA